MKNLTEQPNTQSSLQTPEADFSLTNMIVDALSSTFNDIKNDPIGGISQLLLEGLIFSKIGWIGTIITVILDKGFGINASSLFSAIKNHIIPFMTQNQGKSVNVDSASSQLTNRVLSSLNVSPTDANKSFDQVAADNPELKLASNLLFNQNGTIVKRAFLGGLVAKLTASTLIKSIIKALLVGAGFSAAGEMVSQVVKSTPAPTDETKPATQDKKEEPVKIDTENTILKYVGKPSNDFESNKIYPNDAPKNERDAGQAFYIISSGQFENMIFDLIFRVYPNMKGSVARIIEQNFGKVIPQIKREFVAWNDEDVDEKGTYVRAPSKINGIPINSFKSIVDATLSLYRTR